MLSYEGLTIPQATIIQNQLRTTANVSERKLTVSTVAGADISLNLYSTTIYAGIILLSFPGMQPLAHSLVKAETRFPYVPGYLAFREAPALVQAWEQMTVKPDVLIVDGHGIAHPRRMGIATHFGAVTGQATMGCAKKILCGSYSEPSAEQGAYSPITDKEEQVGFAFRSKQRTAPVFISPGHLLGLNNSIAIIRQCTGKYRIPEPTRLAHELVNRFRRGELKAGFTSTRR
jgi:deoxyribonuclease V